MRIARQPHTHTHTESRRCTVCACAKSDILWINLKLIESFRLDTLLDSPLCYLPLWTPEIHMQHTRARARAHTARVKAPLRLQLLRTVAIEHRIRIENEAESRETGGRKFKIFFKINSQQQQQHTTSMLTRESEATSNRTVARACRSMFEPCATCVLQWSKTSVRIACFFY